MTKPIKSIILTLSEIGKWSKMSLRINMNMPWTISDAKEKYCQNCLVSAIPTPNASNMYSTKNHRK